MVLIFVSTFILLLLTGSFYYMNLPKFTYEEAAHVVKEYVNQSDKNVHIQIPMHREDKLGFGKKAFFKTTNHTYYIYVKVEGDINVYKFYPLDGSFERHTGDRKLEG